MTVIAAIRIPGSGAVLAGEGRVLSPANEVLTDGCDKLIVCGTVMAGVAGRDGGLLRHLSKGKNWSDIVKLAGEYTALKPELEWDLLAYDRKSDQIFGLDSDGCEVELGNRAAIGEGGPYSLGWLDAKPKVKSLEDAAGLLKRAVHATIRRVPSCGGRVRLITSRRRSAPDP